MKLSVIITNYNKMPMLNYLLWYFNTYKTEEVEIICIDDSSDIKPKDIDNIKYIENIENLGIGKVRQQGLDIAKGKYIVFVDGDDIVTTDYLSTILQHIDTEADIYEFKAVSYPYAIDYSNDIGKVWNKVYKKSFLEQYHCCFQDVKIGEDTSFNELVYINNPTIEKISKTLYLYNMMVDKPTLSGNFFDINSL